jgi:hypothetical protein
MGFINEHSEFPMHTVTRVSRFAFLSLAAIVLAACAGQKEPAQKLIADIEATATAASAEASKYVPDELADVQTKLDALKASYAKQDYAAVVAGAPAVLGAAQSLATDAAAKKDAALKALNDQWTGLAGSVPGQLTAVNSGIEFLGKKANKKLAAGVDLDAAKTGAAEANSLWSKAQAAFAAGNLDEAVATGKEAKSKIETVAAPLKLDRVPPAKS